MGDVGPPLDPFGPGAQPIGSTQFDWRATVMSQYANSPTLIQLIENYAAYFDFTTEIDNFFDFVWNVDTAQGFGLDIWGRIVGVGRALLVSSKFFGFEEAGTFSADPFNQSPFYSGPGSTSNFLLSDNAYRQLILAKALANICGGSIPDMNQVLLLLFPNRGVCYVQDNGDMTMVYVFQFQPTPVETAIIEQSGVLPRPTGVAASVVIT